MVSDGIAIWDAATGRELRRTVLPGAWLNAWAWLPDGRLMAVLESSSAERRCSLADFNAAKVKPQELPPEDNGNTGRFAISPDGNVVAVSKDGRDGQGYTVEFRELSRDRPARALRTLRVAHGPKELATILRFTPDGRTLLAFTPPRYTPGDTRWTAVVWDVATATEQRRLTLPQESLDVTGQCIG